MDFKNRIWSTFLCKRLHTTKDLHVSDLEKGNGKKYLRMEMGGCPEMSE
jgi:hypothetical protein